jgi:hypothetical protein
MPAQLRESNIPFHERLVRLEVLIAAGCSRAELETDLQVALSLWDEGIRD